MKDTNKVSLYLDELEEFFDNHKVENYDDEVLRDMQRQMDSMWYRAEMADAYSTTLKEQRMIEPYLNLVKRELYKREFYDKFEDIMNFGIL